MQKEESLMSKLDKVIRHSLVGQIFVGDYVTRRYVEPLQVYRDVIAVHEEEGEFVQCLKSVLHILDKSNVNFWIGITQEEADESTTEKMFFIWVDLEKLTLGKYWFQVESVEFEMAEIFLKVKVLRCYNEKEYNIDEKIHISLHRLQEILTLDNIWQSIRFSAVLVMAFITFAANGLLFVADYTIRLIYALSAFMDSLTPIILATLNFWARCVAGLYWLILMMWRGNPSPPLHRYPMPLLENTMRKQYKPIKL